LPRRQPQPYANRYCNGDRNSYGDCYCDSNGDCHGYGNCGSERNSYSYSHSHSYVHAYAYGHGHIHANTDGHSHSHGYGYADSGPNHTQCDRPSAGKAAQSGSHVERGYFEQR
jgi:hypothetical protein